MPSICSQVENTYILISSKLEQLNSVVRRMDIHHKQISLGHCRFINYKQINYEFVNYEFINCGFIKFVHGVVVNLINYVFVTYLFLEVLWFGTAEYNLSLSIFWVSQCGFSFPLSINEVANMVTWVWKNNVHCSIILFAHLNIKMVVRSRKLYCTKRCFFLHLYIILHWNLLWLINKLF